MSHKNTEDLVMLRQRVTEYDHDLAGLPEGLVVAQRATILALIDECEAARAAPLPSKEPRP